MNWEYKNFIAHYGIKFRSGRYPYGSGENPFQHDAKAFKERFSQLREEGLSETDIAKYFGINTTQLRTLNGLATSELRAKNIEIAEDYRNQGLNTSEIARKMGVNESSVRSYLNEKSKARVYAVRNVTDFLKEQVDKKGMIDVGAGVELELGISEKKLKEALYVLETEGYKTYTGSQPQVTNKNQKTNIRALCPPGTEYKEIYNGNIATITDYTFDPNDPYAKPHKSFVYPESMDSKRLAVRYAEEGGKEKDGLIEIRRNVPDLSLGNSNYAQVRIMVDGTHYLKGMAVYSDDLPEGVDVVFNTNKSSGTPVISPGKSVLKPIKDDPDNPFGSLIKEKGGQSYYEGSDGKQHLSLINKTREEGDWDHWSDSLPSQFLAKQNLQLVHRQLDISKSDKDEEFKEIMALTQPTVRKQMLKTFADDCDAAAVELQAASLPGQKYKVILPCPSLKDNEIYAPTYENGTRLSLVRFPHAGTFEIPELVVNNKNREAKKMLGNALDAVALSSKNAEILSGADFDGDTVITIPNSATIKISNKKPLEGLKGFDPSVEYPKVPGMKVMVNSDIEMGKVSNLITDMTIKGAPDEDIVKAVRHSMVVIDAKKHEYNYKASEIDNEIKRLKDTWQGRYEDGKWTTGASTILSRAKGEVDIPKRIGTPHIDKETGEYIYREDPDRWFVNREGKTVERTMKSTQMAEVKDARKLSSGTPVEEAYADYANHMKALGNQARKEYANLKEPERSTSASRVYAKEISNLEKKLEEAQKNQPRERMAQRLANSTVKAKMAEFPELKTDKTLRGKIETSALRDAREAVGAKRTTITITDREWEAIQASAVSPTKLKQIFRHVDADELRKRATPRETATISESKIARMRSMDARGKTINEIANALGVSVSTVNKYLKED